MATPEGKKAGKLVTSNYTSDAGALNYLQGVLHDDLAEKFREIMTGKGKVTASDFDDILPQLTAKLEPDKHSMSDVLSSNDLRILGFVLPQGHLDRLRLIGLNIEDKSPGKLTKKKVADALKDIGQAHLAKVLSDKEGIQKLQSEIYQTVYIRALKDPKSFTVNLQLFRMCLFGVPRSGKTTFWNRLVNDDFDTDKLSQSTPLAEQHHIHVSQVSMDMVMLYNWHLCSDDGSSKSENEIDKEALVIYNRILKSCNISASMNRDAPPTPSDSAEVAHHYKRDDLMSEEVKVKDASPSIQETNVRVSLPQPVVNDEILRKIDSIFKKLQKSLTSIGEVPDVSSLRQLINLSDVGGQRAFLELLPILTTGSALYLIFFSYANSLTEPLRDIYQGSEKCFNLANKYSQIEVIMQSLRCVATSSSSEDDLSKDKDEDSGAKVTALLVGTHTDKRSDHKSIEKDNEDIRSNVKGFLDSNKSILEYANVKQEDLVLEVNNKTKHKEEFDRCKEVLMRVALGKFSRNEKQLPGSWLMFMIMLRKMKLARHSVLQYDHCKYIASKLFIPTDEASMNGLLHFMHKDLGVLMYYPEVPYLKRLVICDPAIVFTAISEIIIPSFTNDAVTVTDKAFLHFKKHGVFAYQTVDDLTKKKEDFLESKRLVPLLQHLGVIAPIQFSDQDSKSRKKFKCQLDHDCVQDSQHCIHAEYIIPCVIKGTTSAEAEAIDQHCSKNCMIAPLKIAFECKFAPMGGFCYLFTKLLTEKSSDWKPYLPEIHVPDSKCPINRLLRRNKITFLVDQKFFVTFVASATDFKVFIVRGDSNDQTGYEFVCHKVRNAIKNALSTCPNHQVRNFKTAFRCNGHTRGYRHNEHLMIVNQKSINSAKITAVCDEEKRKIDIDPDDLSIMVWFKGPFKLVKEPLSDLRKPFRGEFKLTVSTNRAICNFQWKRIGRDLKLSDPLCVGVHSPTLHFKCFCKAYEGAYICTITDPTKQLQSESLSANLMLDAPKEFDKEMTTEDFYAYLNGQGMSLGDCNKIRDLVITEKNFSADCIPSGISDDGKMKFKEVLKDLKPKITEQPKSLNKYCGEEAGLRVVAEGSGKITYQWQKNGKNIADGKMYQGATNHTLTINPLQSRHAGQYSCFIENDYGTAVSKQVELALIDNIKIIEQTQPCLSSHFSEEVILYVSATGQVGLEYQWKKDGKDIHNHDYKCAYIGTNTDKLKITSMSDKLQGIYQCVVSNAMDFVESGEISLTMEMKQRIENMKHYEAYEEALKGGLRLTLRYLKFLFFGPPRSGKTSTRRRLLKEIINLDQLGVSSISTGVAETNAIIIKKLTSEQVAIVESQWKSIKTSKEGTQLGMYDGGDLVQLFYQLIYKQSTSTTPATSSEPIPKQSASTTPATSSEPTIKQSASTTPATSSEPTPKQSASTTPATSSDPTPMQDSNEHSKSEASDLSNPAMIPVSTNNPTGENTKQDEQSDDATKQERLVTQRLSDTEKSEINDAFENLTTILRSDSPEDLKRLLEDLTMINMADVGGQPAFLDMLPALTIGPALYLLFFRLDQELQKHYPVHFLPDEKGEEIVLETSYCIEEVLYQCLASIACFSSPSQADPKAVSKSGALLFGTYKDMVDDAKISQVQRTLEDKLKATKLYKEGLILKPRALKNRMAFTVDNMKGTEETEMKDIRKDIEGIIKTYFPAIPIPASWLMFRVVLHLLNKSVLSLTQCEEIAKRLSMPTPVHEAIWFFHHDIGSLMHYSNIPSMEDTVICNPQVIFDSISTLIIDKFQIANRAITAGEVEDFHQRGLFTLSHIQDTTDHPQSSLLKLNQLIDVLKHHNILAEVKQVEEVTSSSESEPEPKFIMPAVMKYASESELLSPSSTLEAIPSPIFIHFAGGFIPFGVFCAGVAHLIAQLDSGWQLCDDQLMRNKAKFIIDKAFFATLISRPQYIMIHIEKHQKARCKTALEVICSKVRKTVVQALETVILNMKYKPYGTLQVSIEQPFELAFTCNLEDSHSDHFMIVTKDDSGHHTECLKSQIGFDLENRHLIWFKDENGTSSSTTDVQPEYAHNEDEQSINSRPHSELLASSSTPNEVSAIDEIAAVHRDLECLFEELSGEQQPPAQVSAIAHKVAACRYRCYSAFSLLGKEKKAYESKIESLQKTLADQVEDSKQRAMPTLRNLFKELFKVVSNWENIGVMLDIDEGHLKKIKADHKESKDCLREMLCVWLKKVDPPPSWNLIVDALKSLGEEKLAQELNKKYCV